MQRYKDPILKPEGLKVALTLLDGFTVVDNWDPFLSEPLVFTKRRRTTPEEQKAARAYAKETGRKYRHSEYTQEEVSLYTPDINDATRVVFMSGLTFRFKAFLERNGIVYTEIDKRVKHVGMLKADFTKLETLRGPQAKVIASVLSSQGGIVNAATGFGKSFVIKQLCRILCEKYTILIVTRRRSVITQLYTDIRKDLFNKVGMLCGGVRDLNGKRVICVTEASLKNIDPAEVDILLYDEAHGVGDNDVGKVLAKFHKSRKYGFTATPVRGDNAERTIEALFGPVLIKVGYEAAVAAGNVTPIQVKMLDNGGLSWLGKKVDGVERARNMPSWIYERYAYWQNHDRNRAIAIKARDIRLACPDEQILIMVNTLEHAVALHQHLPGYLVMYSGTFNEDNLKKSFEKYKRKPDFSKYKLSQKNIDKATAAFRKGTLKRVISTGVWKEGVDFASLSHLIRADAGSSPISSSQIPGRLSRLAEGKECGILYDFTDTFCERATRKSEARVKEYRGNGWEVVYEK